MNMSRGLTPGAKFVVFSSYLHPSEPDHTFVTLSQLTAGVAKCEEDFPVGHGKYNLLPGCIEHWANVTGY